MTRCGRSSRSSSHSRTRSRRPTCRAGRPPTAARPRRALPSTSSSTCTRTPPKACPQRTPSPRRRASSRRFTRSRSRPAPSTWRPTPMAVHSQSIAVPGARVRQSWLDRTLEREAVFSWLMLTPAVLFLLAFVAYPFVYGVYLSLEERHVAQEGTFVGLLASGAKHVRVHLRGHHLQADRRDGAGAGDEPAFPLEELRPRGAAAALDRPDGA